MIREIVWWFRSNGYRLFLDDQDHIDFEFVDPTKPQPDTAVVLAKVREAGAHAEALKVYLKKLPAWEAVYTAWQEAWDNWKADPDPAHTQAHRLTYAEASIQMRLPFYDEWGNDIAPEGWRIWSGQSRPVEDLI